MRRNQMRWLFIKEAEQGIYERSRYYSLRQASSKEMTGEFVATKVFLTTDILSVTTEAKEKGSGYFRVLMVRMRKGEMQGKDARRMSFTRLIHNVLNLEEIWGFGSVR
jgi:hypothetical protein